MAELTFDYDYMFLLEEDIVFQLDQLCKERWKQSQMFLSDHKYTFESPEEDIVSQLEQLCKQRWKESQIASVHKRTAAESPEESPEELASFSTEASEGQARCPKVPEQIAAPQPELAKPNIHRSLSAPLQTPVSLQVDPRAGPACQPFRLPKELRRCSEKHYEVAIKSARNLIGLANQGRQRLVPDLLEAPSMAAAPWVGHAPTYATEVNLSKGSHELQKPDAMPGTIAADTSTASVDTCEGSSSSRRASIDTCEGSSSSSTEEEPRTIVVHISAEVDPYVAACEDGKLLVKAPSMRVSLSTSIQPPGSLAETTLLPISHLDAPLPALEELVFDPVSKMPHGCRCESSSLQHVGLMELPADFGASLRSDIQNPRGVLQLQTGPDELTCVNFTGDIHARFSMVPGKRAVSLDLEYQVICALSGAGSWRFSGNGQCLEPPVASSEDKV